MMVRDRRDRVFRELGRVLAAEGVVPAGVVHVGGNVGQELPLYRTIGFGRAVLVEPLPDAVKSARREAARLRWPEVEVVQAAVGTRTGPVTLHVTGDARAEMSSTLRPEFRRSRVTVRPLQVDQVRLDAVPQEGCNVLAVDVQGSEADVLRSGSLDGFEVVVVEVRYTPAYAGQADPAEVAGLLEGAGFVQVLEVENRTIADQVWVRR